MKLITSVPVLTLLLAVAGCGDSEASGVPSWQGPEAYEFELDSSCGERALIGRFHVIVEGGSVVAAKGLDESGRAVFEHGSGDEVPTLSELLDQAATAKQRGAEVVEVRTTDDGRPTEIDIDWDADAVDDEACYRISGYSAGS